MELKMKMMEAQQIKANGYCRVSTQVNVLMT